MKPLPTPPPQRWGGDFAIPFARPRGPMPQAWVRSTTTGAAVPVEVPGTRPLRVCGRPSSLVIGTGSYNLLRQGSTPAAYSYPPWIRSRSITTVHCSVRPCITRDALQSIALARRHARNLHANACRGSQTRCKPHGSRGRVPKHLVRHRHAVARATRCSVQTIARCNLLHGARASRRRARAGSVAINSNPARPPRRRRRANRKCKTARVRRRYN